MKYKIGIWGQYGAPGQKSEKPGTFLIAWRMWEVT